MGIQVTIILCFFWMQASLTLGALIFSLLSHGIGTRTIGIYFFPYTIYGTLKCIAALHYEKSVHWCGVIWLLFERLGTNWFGFCLLEIDVMKTSGEMIQREEG